MRNAEKFLKLIFIAIKLFIAQIVAIVSAPVLNKKDIWIFSEKKTEARDNGYHFFRYIRCEHPEINAVYVITKNSPDRDKVEKLGKVIDYDSFVHCLYFFSAKERVCSQIHGVRPFEEYSGLKKLYFYKRKGQKQINLKHGISKDFRPEAFDYRKAEFDLYVSGAKPEYDYIKKTFSYPEKNIVLSGFCRFDALHNLPGPEKTVLIMPTFRSWLRTSDSSKAEASDEEMKKFLESRYYNAYKDLLTDEALLGKARENGYKILFYLHYTFQPYIKAFDPFANDVVTVCRRNEYDVQKLLTSSSMLITDYSSVFFDYGYMMKPMVFYQFDLDEYRDKHYKEGYFSYERDAFGPIVKTNKEVVDFMLHTIDRNMKMDDEYMSRAKRFFIPHDNHNCQRVYEAILRLDEE
ncbi:MAG: CDP-glycerol glycerophosphotransferase family protein [Clostridia bacterium]|nr:CDP-glycerol glycerophosphotransferase family protein [Clostridia bacterium]